MGFGKYILVTVAAALALAGCLRDDSAECPVVPGGKNLVSISMNVPGAAAAATRAVDETSINTLDVVVFTAADQFVKVVPLSPADITPEGSYLTFKIDMPYNDADTYRFVLLANLRSELGTLTLNSSTARQAMLADLKFDVHYASSAKTMYLPMWGETESAYAITKATSIPTVQMIRSVARMELKVDESISSLFVPGSIKVPYQYLSGRAAPLEANYHKGGRKVTAPSLFDTTLSVVTNYTDPKSIMYMAEYDKSAAKEFCLLVNAAYNGVNGWYKVILRDNYGYKVDILRNHTYTVTVKEVVGPGFDNWQDALDNNTYIQAEVVPWNEAPQGLVFGEHHYLDVSHPSLKLYAEQGWIDVTFSTNFPGTGDKSGSGNNFIPGVTWQWKDGIPTWIQAEEISGGVYTKTVRLSWNAATAANTAAIKVTAGNMNYILHISQGTDTWLEAESVAIHMDERYYGQMPVSSPIEWDAAATGGTGMTRFSQTTFSSAENSNYLYFRLINLVAGDASAEYGYFVNVEFTNSEYHYTPKMARVAMYGKIPEDANCYVVPPDKVIVVRTDRANSTSFGAVVGNSDKVGSELIWSDNPLSLPTSSVEWAFGSGRGPGALLAVKTGSAEGNATVAITTLRKASEPASLGANVIRWSWHFWVSTAKNTILGGTGFYNRWMDRNLGAKTLGTSQDSWGLYYQWGRKDPFPHTNSYYGPSGAMTFNTANNVTPSMSTLAEIIRNPMKTDGTTDWNGSDGLSCWNGSQKSVYDPCPAGWKIPNEHDIPPLDIYSANTDNMTISGYGTFQFCGYRDNVQLKEQGAKGYYWYTHAGILPLKSFSVSEAAYFHSGAGVRNIMYNVRCIKDLPPVAE